jgi:hypothetical protein
MMLEIHFICYKKRLKISKGANQRKTDSTEEKQPHNKQEEKGKQMLLH